MVDNIPKYKVAARVILKSWKLGKVAFYTAPPELPDTPEESGAPDESGAPEESGATQQLGPQFKQDWGKDLDINSIITVNMENASSELALTIKNKKYIVLKPPPAPPAPPAETMDVED